jgi:hypothetical protein
MLRQDDQSMKPEANLDTVMRQCGFDSSFNHVTRPWSCHTIVSLDIPPQIEAIQRLNLQLNRERNRIYGVELFKPKEITTINKNDHIR